MNWARVARSFLALLVGNSGTQIVQVLAIALAAREAGAAVFGVLAVGLAVNGYVALLSSLGFVWHGVQAIARDRSTAGSTVADITVIRVAIALVLLVPAVWNPLGVSADYASVIAILAVSTVVDCLSPDWVFMAIERQELLAVVSAVRRLVLSGVVLLCLYVLHVGALLSVPLGTLAATAVGTVLAFILVQRAAPVALHWSLRPSRWRRLIRDSMGLHGGALFVRAATGADVLIISRFWDAATVGWYSVASRVVSNLQVIRDYYTNALLAPLSDSAERSRERFCADLRSSVRVALVLAGLVTGLGGLYGPLLVEVVFGSEYASSGASLRVLLVAFGIGAVSTVLRQALIALRRNGVFGRSLAIGSSASVLLMFALAPRWGAMGTAGALLLAEALTCGLLAWQVRDHLTVTRADLLAPLSAAIGSAGLGLAIFGQNVVLSMVLAACAYAVLTLVVDPRARAAAREAGQRLVPRVRHALPL